LTEGWSNGQTEGHINRLKTLKRAMYGRAGAELLRVPLRSPIQHEKCGRPGLIRGRWLRHGDVDNHFAKGLTWPPVAREFLQRPAGGCNSAGSRSLRISETSGPFDAPPARNFANSSGGSGRLK